MIKVCLIIHRFVLHTSGAHVEKLYTSLYIISFSSYIDSTVLNTINITIQYNKQYNKQYNNTIIQNHLDENDVL